jgi:putative flippase GtrA
VSALTSSLVPLRIAAAPSRYVVIGVICALAQNGVMIAGSEVGLHYFWGTMLCFATVTPFAHLCHCRFTFKERWSLYGLVRFAGGVATAVPVSLAVMMLLCSGLRLPMIYAAPVVTVVMVFWNYASARWAIVRRQRAG